MSIEVIYEDNHIIAVNKRSGDLSQPDNTNDPSLIEMIKEDLRVRYNKPGNVFLGSIHRLDRPVTGAIIYAKTSKALGRMNEIFKNKEINKIYLVLVDKKPKLDRSILTNYIKKDSFKNKSFVTTPKDPDAKYCKLEYKTVGSFNGFWLLRVKLYTGRHHQIRVQLSQIGCKIVGDVKYGYIKPNIDKSICLHCHTIEFIHPVSKEPVRIKADIPRNHEWDIIRKNDE